MRIRFWHGLCSVSFILSLWPMAAQAQFGFGLGFPSQSPASRQQTPSSTQGSEGRGRSGPSWFDGIDVLINPNTGKPSPPRPPQAQSPRDAFEARFQATSPEDAVREFEAWQIAEFGQYLQIPWAQPPTAAQISQQLAQIALETGRRPAVLYTVALKQQTHLLLVLPAMSPIGERWQPQQVASLHLTPQLLAQSVSPPVLREVLPDIARETVLEVAKRFRKTVSDPTDLASTQYLTAAQQLYAWIVAPLAPQLRSHGIDTLLFSMDDGLRTIPIAALHDGRQFLAEQYSSALIPSFGLTDTSRPLALKQQPLLAMGISKSTEGLAPLPAVPTEISTITRQLWTGPSQETLDEDSTLANLKQLYSQQRFGVLHLATHAEFKAGNLNESYIQFWNNRLTLPQIRRLSDDLQWKTLPPLQLLVLSACQTALGSQEAELGFAGTALNAGVPSAIASLWSVSDQGTLGLMTGFYQHLQNAPTKADALRQSQLQMLQSTDFRGLTHPYFWSGYTVVGNWN
ncbi:MAG: CHAT domain-containing protein [Thermosynechococcaceae cyanobacterium]